MEISKKDWKRYIKRLSAIDKKAAETMQFWMDENPDADVEELIWVATNVAGRYGEAAGALACEMYDSVATAQGVAVPPAEIAEVPDYGETAKAVLGTMKNKQNTVPSTVGRLVKRVGADTMLKNAQRDGAQFAWVPMGDTCSFCLTLASRGWQYMSKAAMKHGHAEHIHANCDCTYAIRFDESSTVEGYDPDRYLEMYENAEGNTPAEKINSMRRAKYAQDKDRINAQKRAAYAKRKGGKSVVDIGERERLLTQYPNTVQLRALDAPGYVEKFKGITGNEDVDQAIYESAKEILQHRQGTDYEDLYLIDASNGRIIHKLTTCDRLHEVQYDDRTAMAIADAKEKGIKIIAVHNHPGGLPPSLDDGVSVFDNGYARGIAVGHNLEVFDYGATNQHYSREQCEAVHKLIGDTVRFSVEFDDSVWYNTLHKFGMEVSRR